MVKKLVLWKTTQQRMDQLAGKCKFTGRQAYLANCPGGQVGIAQGNGCVANRKAAGGACGP